MQNENTKKKKPYVKPGAIFHDLRTGEITGSVEMIDQFMAECDMNKKQQNKGCVFDLSPQFFDHCPFFE